MGQKIPPRTASDEMVALVALDSDPGFISEPANIVRPGNGTESWAADIEAIGGGTIMSDWASLEDAEVCDPLSGVPLSNAEIRERLGLEEA